MTNFIKSFSIVVLAGGCLLSVPGEAANENLLKKWSMTGTKGNTVIQEDGIIACECKAPKKSSGVREQIILNQTEARTIEMSAESKAENVSGKVDKLNYSIYLDLLHTDGTRTYSVAAGFQPGTHDWEKVSFTHTPGKPIKSLTYILLFRNKTGKVWFRNATLTQK